MSGAFGSRRSRCAISLLGATVAGLALAAAGGLPDVRPLAEALPPETSYMRLRLAERPGGPPPRSDPVPLGAISPYLVCAVVKAEDRAYFDHRGVDWGQMRKAAGRALLGNPGMGGSTISQQTARNLYLGPERSLLRKARETMIATRLEETLGKRRVLEVYLNVIEWGDGVWGVGAASRAHLGSDPAGLDPFESAFLASLVAAPRRPLEGRNRARAEGVHRRVLLQMYRSGLLDDAQWREAWARTDALHAALSRGAPLPAALREARRAAPWPEAPPPPPRGDPSTLPAADAVGQGCGYARERAEDLALRREPRLPVR